MITQTLNYMVGSRLQLCPSESNVRTHYDVDLIGVYQNTSILVSFPPNSPTHNVKAGDKFIVRFNSLDVHYAFRSDVIMVCDQPFPYLHLQFPRGVQGLIVRNKQRVKVRNPSFRLNVNLDRDTALVMSDISHAGAKLSCDRRLGEIDDQLAVEIHNPHRNEHFTLPCVIRYVHANPATSDDSTEKFDFGVRFGDLGNRALEFIQQVISDNQAHVVRR